MALLGLAGREGALVWEIIADARAGTSLEYLVSRDGVAQKNLIVEIVTLLGYSPSVPSAVQCWQRLWNRAGSNFTLLAVLQGGTQMETITLIWPLEEASCHAVANSLSPLGICTTVALGNDYGPAGPAGNFVVIKGTVNGVKASG